MNDAIRSFFDARGLLEVETPILVSSPGLEPHLDPFSTRLRHPDGTEATVYLHTSPEYAMKRLVAAGAGSIYQLARVFRNREGSSTHTPEFSMLEWYRQPGSLADLQDDVVGLVEAVRSVLRGPRRFAVRRTSVAELFEHAGLGDPLESTPPDVFARECSVRSVPDDQWEDVFFRAFLEHIEPGFGPDELVFVEAYPSRLAALARLDPADRRTARRFEAYLGGLELANAFEELSDPTEQRARFLRDQQERRRLGKDPVPIDESLLEALPAIDGTAGIALGLDRLLMKCLDVRDIETFGFTPPRLPEMGSGA